MSIFFSQFIKSEYWFYSSPPFNQGELLFYGIFFLIILLGAILLKRKYHQKSQEFPPYNFFSQKFYSYFLTCTIIGFVLLFFRWQGIPYISSRILLGVDLLIIIITLILFIYYQFKSLPNQISKYQEQQEYQKYIPIPKNKATSLRPNGRRK